MHEAPIAQGILDAALAALPDPQARIIRITVAAGVLAGVERDSLALYFDELRKGTAAENAELELKRIPAHLVCADCHAEIAYDGLGGLQIACVQCGGPNRLNGGSELYIESMEVDNGPQDRAAKDDPQRK